MKKLIFLFLFIALGFSQQTGKWYGDSIVFMQDWSQFENPVCFGDSEVVYRGIDSFYIYVDDNLHQLIFDGDGSCRFKKVLIFDDEIQCYGPASVKAWGDGFYLDWNENGNPFVSFSDADSLWYFRTGKRFTFTSWLQVEDSIKVWTGTDTTKILANKITTSMMGVDDSLWIAQWASAPVTGNSGLFGADTTNDSVIIFLGEDTRAVIYPPEAASGPFISDTIGIIESDDTTYMTADNDTFRVSTEAIVKWEVDDASSYWFAQEFKQISFGWDGRANGDYGSVWGGRTCYAESYSAVVGGLSDSVKANWGFVAGGQANKIETGDYSGIISGHTNKILGGYSFISAGANNVIGTNATSGAIVGGTQDSIGNNSVNCFIGAGTQNRIIGGGDYNAISGGQYNVVEGASNANTICGGVSDTIKNSNEAFIGGGEKNYLFSSHEAAMVGGNENKIWAATQAFIGGGNYNFIQSLRGAIVGGYQDSVKGTYSGILSGQYNTVWGSYSAICAGNYNDIGSGMNYSFIGAGNNNFVNGTYSAIISGRQDTVHANMSVALGGIQNVIRADDGDSCNVVAGVKSIVDSCFATFAMNCQIKKADSTFGFSKQIWVIEAGETTKVEAKKIVSSEYEGDSSTIKAWQDVDSLDAIHAVVNTSMVLVNDATFKRGYFTVEQDFDYTSGTAAIITVDGGWIVIDVYCVIKTIFDGTTPDVTVGDAGNNVGFFDHEDVTKAGWAGGAADKRGAYLWDDPNDHTIQKIYAASTVLNVYVTGSLMTQGNGTIYLGIIRL